MRTRTYITILCLALFLPGFAHASLISRPANNLGLVGYWSFNEGTSTTAGDFSGNGYNTDITGGTWVSGKRGKALSFNGSSDKVVGSAITVGTTMTIAGWVKKDSSTSQRSFFSNRGGSGKVYFGLESTKVFLFDNGGSPASIKSNGGVVTIGEWQHIAVTSDGSTVTMYVNGQQVYQTDQTRTASAGSSFGIGWDPNIGSEYWNGDIDEVRLYNRALSPDEIVALYNAGGVRTKTATKTGLVGYWSFDEGSGTQAGDFSGNGYAGTFSGSVTWREGKFGTATSFDGDSDSIATTMPSNVVAAPFTMSAWVKPSEVSESDIGRYRIVSRFSGASTRTALTIDNGNFRLCMSGCTMVGNYPAQLDTWQYVVGVFKTDGWELYVDGVLRDSGSETTVAGDSTVVRIGSQNSTLRTFAGDIDDVRIYSRALSAQEIKSLYGVTATRVNTNTATGSLNDGLIGYWSFDGSDITDAFYDRSGNGFNGYLVGTNNSTSTRKTIGKVGQAFTFAGSGTGGIHIGNDAALTPPSITIAAWINTDSPNSYSYVYSNARDCCGTYNGYELRIASGHRLSMSVWNGSNTGLTGSTIDPGSGWTHVAGTYDGATERLYINGVEDASTANAVGVGTPASFDTYLGSMGSSGGTNHTLNGALDEVRVYNRALTADEIKRLYNQGK